MKNANPNNVLATQIAKKLLEEGLIDPSSEKNFIQGMNNGNYKESDWKTLLEEIINKPKADTDETQDTSN